MQRTRIDATGEDLSRLRRDRVVRACKSGERVEQDHYVLATLDQSLCFFEHHISHLHMSWRTFVESRAYDLSADSARDHLSHFFRPFVYKKHDDGDLRMVLGDGVGHLVQQNRLSGAWRRHDQTALAFSNGRHDVDDAHAEIAVLRLQTKALVGILWSEIVERRSILGLFRILAVDALYFQEREVALPRLRWSYLSANFIARAEAKSFDLRRRHVDIVGPWQITPVLTAQEAVSFRQNLKNAITVQHDVGVEKILLDLENQILFSETCGAVDLETVGHLLKLSDGFSL